jgi:hypothetical protein
MKNNLQSTAAPVPLSSSTLAALGALVPFRCSVCDYPKGTESGWCGRCHWYTAGARG